MQIRLFVALLLVVCVLSGCQEKRPAGMPVLYPCEVTITQGGAPLGDADVNLMPEVGSSQWVISGHTDANGVTKIMTHGKYSGAPAGPFKVLVSKTLPVPSKYPEPGPNGTSEEWTQWSDLTRSEYRPPVRYVKPEYADVSQTPHSITISKGKNSATFDVGEAIEEIIQ